MSDLLQQVYHPDLFRQQGHALIDLLADFYQSLQNDPATQKVLQYRAPEELYQKWETDLQNGPHSDEMAFYKTILQELIHLHHPRYMGHQTSVVAPPSALAELLGAALDPGMGVYEQGTSGVVIERLLSKKLGGLVGWDEQQCDGFMTSGGTLGNLTALLCARQVMIGEDVWKNGYQGKQYAFMVSAEAHYSVSRAIQVMGMGSRGVVAVPVDEHYRLQPALLNEYFVKAKNDNIEVIGVIASSCSTATGSYDPIDEIADFCREKKLWLHVDGAHGACVLFSKKYKHLLKGIDRADSVIMDFHKMLMTPKLITSVLFKNAEHSYQTFAQKASYLWDKDEDHEWYNFGKRTFELTKSFMSVRVYTLWRKYGEALFEENVDRLYDLARQFAKIVAADSHFDLVLHNPESNILCFRYFAEGWSEEKTEMVNLEVREKLVRAGNYFVVQTRVKGRLYLRTTIMNPFTTGQEFKGLLSEIKELAESI